MREVDKKYLDMIIDIYNNGRIVRPRGLECRELLGYRFELSNMSGENNIIKVPGLETNLNYAPEEFRWYLDGNPSIDFSPIIKKNWERFSPDHKTSNSNYGTRIFGKGEKITIDQWEWVKSLLKRDPDTRQAILNIHSYFDKNNAEIDVPCTMGIEYFIRDKKLDGVVMMRSNDVYLGFRNDLYCFGALQQKMASELGIEVGRYIHFSGSMHLYSDKYEKVKIAIKNELK